MNVFNSDVLDRLAVAVDLANAMADGALPGTRRSRPRWIFEPHGYRSPTADRDWQQLAALADRVTRLLALIVSEEHDTAVDAVNRWLRDGRTVPSVQRRDDGWVLHFHSEQAPFTCGWAGGIAAAVALGYSTGDVTRVGCCTSPGCGRLFLDRGRNQQRRFCSLRCQNRAKSSQYRQRRR